MAHDRVLLAHGSGGLLSHELVERIFLPRFENPALASMDDSAVLSIAHLVHTAGGGRPLPPEGRGTANMLAFTTDSYVVKPLFWNGGNIGRLAICGTVNDLAMVGARALCLTAGFIVEEGLPISILEAVADAMKSTAEEAGVSVVAGDTKVVERGGADGLFINTAGVGLIPQGVMISGRNARPGDVVLVSGYIGDHGIAVLSQREGLEFGTNVASDVAPLNGLVEAILYSELGSDPSSAGQTVRVLRDPTRGGLGTTLNEIARQSNVGIRIYEERVPVREEVAVACEMLGYDPLYVANEGKLVAVVSPHHSERVLEVMRRQRYGENAAIIGEVIGEPRGKVLMKTAVGGTRIINVLTGEMLPRIC